MLVPFCDRITLWNYSLKLAQFVRFIRYIGADARAGQIQLNDCMQSQLINDFQNLFHFLRISPPVPSQILAPELIMFVKYVCTVEQLVLGTRQCSISYPGSVPMWGVMRQHVSSLDK